jgi:hypothetical protein
MSTRVEALAFKGWRERIFNMIHTANYYYKGEHSTILHRIREKLAHFDDEFSKLKEATTILELALWKLKMNERDGKQDMALGTRRKSRQMNQTAGNNAVFPVELMLSLCTCCHF